MNAIAYRLLSLLVSVVALNAATPCAFAAGANPDPALTPAVRVHFADLNPSTAAGARALYDRIADAAQSVCGPVFSLWDANAHRTWKACYRATIDHTVSKINRPELTALHQKTIGNPVRSQIAASPLAAVKIR